MSEINRKLNQSVDLTNNFIYDVDRQTDITQLDTEEPDVYLRTERANEEPDYRMISSRSSELKTHEIATIQTETPADSELRADILEFLRQIFKVTERLDSAGLLLKHVFGKFDMEESDEVPKARRDGTFLKL